MIAQNKIECYRWFLTAHARLLARLERALQEAGSLSPDVYDVLVTLEYAEGHRLRLSELAQSVLISRSGLTRRLDRLESLGYIRRTTCPRDRRGTYAELTEAGQRARESAWPHYRQAVAVLFADRLTDEEADLLRRACERLAAE
ncbi:MAG: MarR family transcriptional regulator [Fimbriimonadaceae bacterium]|nr:MarR family transcriptional regulator [Fimbriimonadaceae bacterium]